MMSLKRKPHHKILGMPEVTAAPVSHPPIAALRPQEAGYTLVALIALMTLLALFAMAAAPSIVQQAQREREKEAIFRGEEIAEAIRIYYNARVRTGRTRGDTALPTDIQALLDGVPIAGRTKKLQILRASAAQDPQPDHTSAFRATAAWMQLSPIMVLSDMIAGSSHHSSDNHTPTTRLH